MYIFSRRIYSNNDLLVKIWAIAGLVILATAALLIWSDRFRESVDTSIARISAFGIEIDRKEDVNFTGSRGFFNKMNKMGLPARTRLEELDKLFSTLSPYQNGDSTTAPPAVLWIYADGLTKENRDRGVQTYGKVFFEKAKFCFSIVDVNGFSIQLDPNTFHVLWAKDGGAICAIPLLLLPEDHNTKGFAFRIEERGNDGQWKRCGEIAIPPTKEANAQEFSIDTDSYSNRSKDDFIFPRSVSIESLTFPRECRFFSASLWDRNAFGKLVLRIHENASGKVPAAAWSLDDFGIGSSNGIVNYSMMSPDAFNTNVRFLDDEPFENATEGRLHVPVAKAIFPHKDKDGSLEPWRINLRFVRNTFFPEDLVSLSALRIGKNNSVLPEIVSAKNSSAKIRAFRDDSYFRQLNGNPDAIVLEIQQTDALFWAPYRVKTDKGDELLPESTVHVKPGIRQYWFLPKRHVPEKIEVTYAITKPYYQEIRDTVPIISDKQE